MQCLEQNVRGHLFKVTIFSRYQRLSTPVGVKFWAILGQNRVIWGQIISYQLNVSAYILVSVPVEARLFKDKPVLPPLLGEVAFSILLLP